MVLDGDLGQKLLALFKTQTILGEIAGCHHGETGRRRLGGEPVAPGGDRPGLRQAGKAGVLQLLGADGQHDVVHTGGYGIAGRPNGFRTGGAGVFHVGHRDIGELERGGQYLAGFPGEDAPPPGRLDIFGLDSGVFVGLVGSIDDHVFQALSPVLTELDTAHSHDGYSIFDAIHGLFPCLRALASHRPAFPPVVVDAADCNRAGGRSFRAALPP